MRLAFRIGRQPNMCYRATRLITKWHSLTPGGIDDRVLREDHLYLEDKTSGAHITSWIHPFAWPRRVATGVLSIVSQKLEQER